MPEDVFKKRLAVNDKGVVAKLADGLRFCALASAPAEIATIIDADTVFVRKLDDPMISGHMIATATSTGPPGISKSEQHTFWQLNYVRTPGEKTSSVRR